MSTRFASVVIALSSLFTVGPITAAEPIDVRANYTKYEYRIPMRDGVRLFTAVYVPKDSQQKYPFLLKRTPYACKPYGVDQYPTKLGPSDELTKSGYIFVFQDVRGRWMSEGELVNMRPYIANKQGPRDVDETSDTYDTIDWLVKHVPNNNGLAGQWGVSYPGFYTSCGMIDAHPALKASSPQAPICDWFIGDDWHHHGALQLTHAFNFLANFGRPRPEPTKKFDFKFEHGVRDGYRFFSELGPLKQADPKYFQGQVAYWNEVMKHGSYDDYWQARNLRPHLKNIKPAVLTVGGWFDAENLFGALETYRAVEKQSPGATNTIVMGPWVHGGWSGGDGASLGDATFAAKTGDFYRSKIEFPFFEFHLKGKGDGKRPEAWMFETGTNVWREYSAWPPQNAKPREMYFREGGKLAEIAAATADRDQGYDEYPSDPRRPVPYMERIETIMAPEYMTADQRFASRRPDVLVYQTELLEQDLTVAGPIEVELYVSTTGTDSDWVVKVIDVYPDDLPDPNPNPRNVRLGGYQQLVRGDIFRGKFRESFSQPKPFVPGEQTLVKFTLQDVNHVFRPGHRLMVQVQSSWFPLFDRNPQKFVDIYAADERDFQVATQRVYREPNKASKLRLLTLP
ncbi:MAG: CocE/NonD family hydrolase [Planctomycetaceae bacterium]|nr:CocE/NonD family hydrolase [Planctomycetaceae bacterium]